MPSHIYFALGMWDEASAINERSMKAADARREAKKLDVEAARFSRHALAGLQLRAAGPVRGVARAARAAGGRCQGRAARCAPAVTWRWRAPPGWLSHASGARPRRRSQPRAWRQDAAMADLFAIGLAAIRSGNRMAGGNALQQMAALMEERPPRRRRAEPLPSGRPAATAGGGPWPASRLCPVRPGPGITPLVESQAPPAAIGHAAGTATRRRRGRQRAAQIMAQQLEAVLLFSEGRREEALVLARQAAVVEDSLSFEFGPPVPVKPAHELVGEMLMDLRRPKEAIPAFESSLKRNPQARPVVAGPRPGLNGDQGHRPRHDRLRRAAEDLEERRQGPSGTAGAGPGAAAEPLRRSRGRSWAGRHVGGCPERRVCQNKGG